MQPGCRLGEDANKDAQHHLVPRSRMTLRGSRGEYRPGGDLQGNDGEGEHQPGDRDHCR
jgi:hypothetical protein